MSDYVFCVRSIRKGAFIAEPGASHFLKIPANVKRPRPKHGIRKSTWFSEVRKAGLHGPQDDLPRGDIVMYVHGFNTSQEVMLERHRLIRKALEANGFEGIVVSFDWPSDDMALNYLEDRVDAKQTAFRLVDEGIKSFAALQRPDCRVNLHLLAHSMGCYVVREAFDDADDRPGVAASSWSVSQIMMLSGDISAASMERGSSKTSSLYRHCVRLTNYFNPFDDVLTLSNIKRIGVSPRVGRIGMPENVPQKAVDVNCGNYFHKNRAKFSGLPNAAHTWYFHDKKLMTDVFHTISGHIDRFEIPGRQPGDRGNLVLT